MASFWKSSGTASARRALFLRPCLWRCGRSKPLGAKLVEVVREFAAHIPFHAGGVPRHVFAFSDRAADICALRSHRRAGGGGKPLIAANVAMRRIALPEPTTFGVAVRLSVVAVLRTARRSTRTTSVKRPAPNGTPWCWVVCEHCLYGFFSRAWQLSRA